MPQRFQITLVNTSASADVISLLRRVLGQPVGTLKQKIVNEAPIIDEKPNHNEYEAFIDSVTTLLRGLDDQGIRYAIVIDGRQESAEYVGNIFRRWREIGRELQEYDDRIAQAEENRNPPGTVT